MQLLGLSAFINIELFIIPGFVLQKGGLRLVILGKNKVWSRTEVLLLTA